jgi:hypothetical protein
MHRFPLCLNPRFPSPNNPVPRAQFESDENLPQMHTDKLQKRKIHASEFFNCFSWDLFLSICVDLCESVAKFF